MGFMKIVVILAVITALAGYWLYAPLPPGYSSETRRQFQFVMIGMKLIGILSRSGAFLGFGSQAVLQRNLVSALEKSAGPKLHIDGITTSDTVFDGVPVRIYRPPGSEGETLPGIVYYHGGGFTYGSIDSSDVIAKRLCNDTRSVVVSVEYRLAPEFPFPAGVDDCTAATMYFLSNAAEFNVDARRVAVSGDSAGGNLAAVVSMRLRDDRFPIPIKLQVLIYPATQTLDFALPSMIQNRDGPLLTLDAMPFFAAMYLGREDRVAEYAANRHVTKSFRQKIAKTFLSLEKLPKEFLAGYERPAYPDGDAKLWGEIKDRLLNPYHSPLTADDLQDLPEAYVLTANYDPLRDEGYLYGLRLREANNKVALVNAENGFHGMVSFVEMFPEVQPIFEDITKFIREKL